MTNKTFRISGSVIGRTTRQGVAGLRVEAWDKDLILDDLVGSDVTKADGTFQLSFDESYFREVFLDRQPDLYFKIYNQEELIKSTEDSVLWNVKEQESKVVIELETVPIKQNVVLLSHAIRKNAVSLAQAQTTYKENVVAVNTVVISVLNSSIPTLTTPPPDIQDFINAHITAQGDALDWVNNVIARLLTVPDHVQGYNAIISQLLQDAKTQASTLVNQPSDHTALLVLNNDLTQLSQQLNIVVTFISGAVTNIQKFQDKLPDLATQLQSIAQKSTVDANADQEKIDQLNADIATLRADIKSLTAAIVALGIADTIAITLGTVATIALWPEGALVWFVLAPAVAVASTYIGIDAAKIIADKAKIDNDLQQISGLTADVATLHVLAKDYADMASQAQAIETNLQAVLNEWLTLESDINAAITDIKTATSDQSSANFNAVLNDLNDAIDEWNAAYKQAGALHVELQVNNAQLEVGMSPSEVQTALAKGQTINIIEYYNQIAA